MTTLSQVYVHVVADRLLLIMSRRILNNRWDLKNFLFILLLFFKLFLVVLNDNTRISPRADKRRPEKVYYVGITNKYPTTRFFALASSDRNLEIECPRRLRNFLGQRNSFVFFGTCFMFPDILQWHWYEFKFILLFHFFCFAICLFLQRICIWTGVTQKRPDRIPAKKKKLYAEHRNFNRFFLSAMFYRWSSIVLFLLLEKGFAVYDMVERTKCTVGAICHVRRFFCCWCRRLLFSSPKKFFSISVCYLLFLPEAKILFVFFYCSGR